MVHHEVEVKFSISDVDSFNNKLRLIGASFIGSAFQRTIRFDTPDNSLESDGKFLRVRSGFSDVITLKSKVVNDSFFEREEIELNVSDINKMRLILNRLGFSNEFIMEKYRSKWLFNNITICVDKLPFGSFIEIEGDSDGIKSVIKELGLDFNNRLTVSYWDLFDDYKKRNNINAKNIVF